MPELPDTPANGAVAALAVAIDQCIALGDREAARQLIGEGTRLAADHPALLVRRGRLAVIEGAFDRALEDFRRATALEPSNPRIWLDRARAAARSLQWPEAVQAFEQWIALKGPRADILAELGHARANGGDLPGAIAAFRTSLEQKPAQSEVWNDLGARLMDAEEFSDAIGAFQRALDFNPNLRAAKANLCVAHSWQGNAAAAVSALRPAESASDRQTLGATLLSFGRLTEGWPEYRQRLENPNHRGWHRGIPKPMWSGGDLSGQRLLIWSDQGLGDQILVAGLLRDASARAARIVFACEPRLFSIIARSLPDVRCVPITEIHRGKVDLSDIDAHASISEIGASLRVDITSFPNHGGYLRADPEHSKQLADKYRALPGNGPVVGLSWRSANEAVGSDKSIDLSAWGPILSVPNARFVSLQYGDVSDVPSSVHVDPAINPVADLDGFAAQVSAMDIVVSVSNTTVHMAGALGVATLCLTPKVEGRPWYWFAGHETSPWYPSVRHVWQTRRGAWGDVLQQAAQLLMNAPPSLTR